MAYLAGYPLSFHNVWQDISMNINLQKHFRKFAHWALSVYYYLEDVMGNN